jgi:hypothetical protein
MKRHPFFQTHGIGTTGRPPMFLRELEEQTPLTKNAPRCYGRLDPHQ